MRVGFKTLEWSGMIAEEESVSENKILSSAALIIKVFIFFIIFLNVKAEVVNKKYFKDEKGVLAVMYHRFEENKYPSTNIRMDDFNKHFSGHFPCIVLDWSHSSIVPRKCTYTRYYVFKKN